MKRKASSASPYERPVKLTKRSTTATVSRSLSKLSRTTTVTKLKVATAKWPRFPTLVPTNKGARGVASAAVEMDEISEEEMSGTSVASLRKVPTLTLAESESPSLSKSICKTKSTSSTGPSIVASLSKRGSVVSLDKSGSVTTVTKLKSGSSVGEMKSLTSAPADIRKELSKAASTVSMKGSVSKKTSVARTASLTKKASSIRVLGSNISADEAEEVEEKEVEESTAEGAGDRDEEGDEELPAEEPADEDKADKPDDKETANTSRTGGDMGTAPAVPLPPGGLIEIVFSFDTTGSMSSCIAEVRGRVGDMIQRLQADIPGIRIAVMAHGDYCDAHNYVIKWIDFGASLPELSDFVQNISGTGGGDFDECYELVLARVQTELSWTPGSQRSLVLIGDATPHPESYYKGKDEKLNWKEEAKKLANMGLKIYAVQALNRDESTSFYQTLAHTTRGRHMKLDQFNNIFDFIMAVCYNEKGLEFVEAYEAEVREREGRKGLHKDLEGMFGALKAGKPTSFKVSKALPKLTTTTAKKPASKGRMIKGKHATVAFGKAKAQKTKASTSRGRKGKATPPTKGKGKAVATKGKGVTSKGKGVAAKGKGSAAKRKASAKDKAKASAKMTAKAARGKGLKAVRGQKASKEEKNKKGKKKVHKAEKTVPSVQRKLRETVPDGELSQGSCLQKVKWMSWSSAILPAKPGGRKAASFKPRSSGGYRNVVLFQPEVKNAPAVYEIKVDIPINLSKPSSTLRQSRRKEYVLGFKACHSWRKKANWEQILLGTPGLRAEVDALLTKGAQGRLFLRMGIVKDEAALQEVESHITKHYDYAWTMRRQGKKGLSKDGNSKLKHRHVKKCNMLISGNDSLV